MKTVICLFLLAVAGFAQAETNTTLNPRQVPPVATNPAAAPIHQETPVAGTVAGTFTLNNPVTNFIWCHWNGVILTVGLDLTFTSNGTGGTLLTLSPGAIAAGVWTATNSTSGCLYQ